VRRSRRSALLTGDGRCARRERRWSCVEALWCGGAGGGWDEVGGGGGVRWSGCGGGVHRDLVIWSLSGVMR